MSKIATVAAFACAVMFMSAAANAAVVTYTNSEPTPKMELTIDDMANPGSFRFSLTTQVGTADFLGLGFNYSGASITQSNISLVSATRADGGAITPALLLFGNNTGSQNSCGSGCNFNGSGSPTLFDYIIRIGEQGGGQNNYVRSVIFDLALAGTLASNPFSLFAVRAQSTSNSEGSIKTSLTPQDIPPVPLPAAFPMLMAGLGAIGLFAGRRNRA